MEDAKRFKGTALGRAALAALALVLAGALAAGLSGCGQPPEELIRDGVESELAEIKAMEGEAWDDVMEGMAASSAGLAQYGVDGEDLCRALLDGFDYKVEKVSVDGSTATVEVETTCRSLAAVGEALNAKVEAYAESAPMEGADVSMVGELLMEAMAEAPLETTTLALPYELDGSTWAPGAGFEPALMKMFGV